MTSVRHLQRPSGLDLKLARIAHGVPQRAMARQLGVSPQRISGIEATYRPTAQICARYLAALDTIAGAPAGSWAGSSPTSTRGGLA